MVLLTSKPYDIALNRLLGWYELVLPAPTNCLAQKFIDGALEWNYMPKAIYLEQTGVTFWHETMGLVCKPTADWLGTNGDIAERTIVVLLKQA